MSNRKVLASEATQFIAGEFDSFAQEFSDLPTNANFASTDKGVGEARTCV